MAITAGHAYRGEVMARWRVDFIGKVLSTLGTVEAVDEKFAFVEAAKQFNIPPARQNKITLTKIGGGDNPPRQ